MYNAQLFLGIPLAGGLQAALAQADESLVSAFVNDHGEYLQEVSHGGQRYLGKFGGDVCDVDQLALLQANIYSMLDKLLPSAACRKIPLVLFPAVVPAPAAALSSP